jgi:GntR family carbon starvation induced transcriptional regulator
MTNFAANEAGDEAVSQAERAYHRLRSGILQGELLPGDRLRASDLQDRYQLGLTPIREALMRLSTEGLVDATAHRGSRVSAASPESFLDLMSVRREIEALCLQRAMTLGDARWEAEIVAAFHLLSRMPLPNSSADREVTLAWETHHRRFHFALVSACRSDWLLRFWNTLADHSERYRALRLVRRNEPAAEVRDLNGEHRDIMQAVVARDVDRAIGLMNAHLGATEKAVSRLLEMPETRA